MYKKTTLILASLCFGYFAQAQDEHDALLLGRTYQYGTARNLSLSGATGSLGADYGAVGNNPAGLGLYRKSEFSFTPNVLATNADGEYQGSSLSESNSRFNFNQASIVFAKAKSGKNYTNSNWKTSNFAIGFNRLANFHTNYTYRGNDTKSSFVENFSEEINAAGGLKANGDLSDNANETISDAAYGAYQVFIIDPDNNDSLRAKSFVPFSTGLERSKTIQRNGANNELAFSYGANYQEKVLIGVTIGIPIINFNETEVLLENDISGDPDNDFDYIDLVQKLATAGSGVNLKFGAIFKPNESFRFGAALHTPTWYSLSDVSSIQIEANTENYRGVSRYQPESSRLFDYRYNSPMKAMASATALFGKQGFLSADVEWINYTGMQYRYGNGFEAAEQRVNSAIKQTYQNAANVRIGGEIRLDEIALRAGYGFYGNPYQDFNDGAAQSASLGVGYRSKGFYIDLGAQYMFLQDPDQTHTLARTNDIPTAVIATNNVQIAATMGFRF